MQSRSDQEIALGRRATRACRIGGLAVAAKVLENPFLGKLNMHEFAYGGTWALGAWGMAAGYVLGSVVPCLLAVEAGSLGASALTR